MDNKDKCINCKYMQDTQSIICQECGSKNTISYYDGPVLIIKCKNCNWSVAGASFYSPCELDREPQYQVKIIKEIPEKNDILVISRSCGINILEVKRCLEKDKVLPNKFTLDKIIKICRAFNEMNIDIEILPGLTYSKIGECKKWME